MDRKTAQAIANEAQKISKLDPLSSHYNIFVFDDGRVELEPVSGAYGAGYPANPEKYTFFEMNVPLAYLKSVEDIFQALD